MLNWKEALEHFGGEQHILRRLLLKFCDRASPTLASMNQALADGRMDALKREAHSLKGSSAYIAAASLQAAALALEDVLEEALDAGDSGPPMQPAISQAMTRICEEQRRVLLAIDYKLSRDRLKSVH